MKRPLLPGILLCLGLTTAGTGYSQSCFDKPVHKAFIQADSSSINTDATLVLYADNSFVNYGVLKDLQNQEIYVWYTFGKWSQKSNQVSCQTYFEQFNQKKTIDMIRANYKKRKDYRMVDSYYEFVNERYQDAPFILIKDKAVDLTKKIEYVEVKPNTSITN